jgi:hypothetical protein
MPGTYIYCSFPDLHDTSRPSTMNPSVNPSTLSRLSRPLHLLKSIPCKNRAKDTKGRIRLLDLPPEILDIIIQYTEPDLHLQSFTPTLRALAHTCRFLHTVMSRYPYLGIHICHCDSAYILQWASFVILQSTDIALRVRYLNLDDLSMGRRWKKKKSLLGSVEPSMWNGCYPDYENQSLWSAFGRAIGMLRNLKR